MNFSPSQETRDKISKIHMGNTYRRGCTISPEHIAKLVAGKKAKPLSDETRLKLSLASLGKPSSYHGEKHHKAKITEEEAKEIKFSKESNEALSKIYPLTVSTIDRIKKGVIWKHVTS